jgi:hypothetical protein
MQFTIDTDLAIVGIVLGVGAIILAVPPFFQMLFGRPDIAFETADFTGPKGRTLSIKIKNRPVTNRLLRSIGVEREVGDILAYIGIQKQGTNEIIVPAIPGLLQCIPLQTIGLQARSLPGFAVSLTVIHTLNGAATVVDARPDNIIPISAGLYVASITIVRGDRDYKIAQSFTIGKLDHQTVWHRTDVVSTLK